MWLNWIRPLIFCTAPLSDGDYYCLSSSTSQEIDLICSQCSVWIGNYSVRKYCSFRFWFGFNQTCSLCPSTGVKRVAVTLTLHCGVSSDTSPGFPLVLFLAPVVFLCVAERIAAGDRHRLCQTLPKVSIGDLPAGPRARAGWADGVWASQAAGHGCLKGQRLHGTRGVWAVVVLLGDQERLRRVASGWGWTLGGLALHRDAVLCFLLVLADRGMCVTNKWRVRNVRARVGQGVWWGAAATRGAGFWSGGHWAVWAVALETRIKVIWFPGHNTVLFNWDQKKTQDSEKYVNFSRKSVIL